MEYLGSCHCGAVRIAVEAPPDLECEECNCSMCAKAGFLHLIVPASRFRLLAGEDALTTYTFNTGTAQHRFCRHCGVKAFYVPRSNPDGYDVNVRCLTPRPRSLTVRPFDGADWERHAHELAHLSRDEG